MSPDGSERLLVERLLARPVASVESAVWGFTNRTDVVTFADGERVVLQRYRRLPDAMHRLRVMRALWQPAADAGIVIPRILESDLAADPPWVAFDVLPGVPVPAAGFGLDDPGFPSMARSMGELLARFRGLPVDGLELGSLWTDPHRLVERAAVWARSVAGLRPAERRALAAILEYVPDQFRGRPAVLAHGDFAPVNVLTDGVALTGLLDFESVRLADALFDPAWWAWAVSFSGPEVLERAWPAFLEGAGIDPTDHELPGRIASLQVLRMLELLGGDTSLDSGVGSIVADRLRATLVASRRSEAPG
jgi:aminoglycoside phosphotransferase (APT) family kinase protein